MIADDTERQFLLAIRENPADDDLRYVYADWLEEQGDPRAELVRVQCQLAALEFPGPAAKALEEREAELLARYGREWTEALRPAAIRNWEFRRGVVESVTLNAKNHLGDAAAMLEALPTIRHLKVNAVNKVFERFLECDWLEKIETLNLHGNSLGNARIKRLIECPRIKHLYGLDIEGNNIGPRVMPVVANAELPQLKWIRISTADFLSAAVDSALRELAAGPFWQHLKLIELRVGWTSERLAWFLSRMPKTDWEWFSGSFRNSEDVATSLRGPAFESIRGLSLHVQFGGESPPDEALAAASELECLEYLDVVSWLETRSDVQTLVNMLPRFRKLKTLALYCPQLDNMQSLMESDAIEKLERIILTPGYGLDAEYAQLAEKLGPKLTKTWGLYAANGFAMRYDRFHVFGDMLRWQR